MRQLTRLDAAAIYILVQMAGVDSGRPTGGGDLAAHDQPEHTAFTEAEEPSGRRHIEIIGRHGQNLPKGDVSSR